jgi:hypothetical protein
MAVSTNGVPSWLMEALARVGGFGDLGRICLSLAFAVEREDSIPGEPLPDRCATNNLICAIRVAPLGR